MPVMSVTLLAVSRNAGECPSPAIFWSLERVLCVLSGAMGFFFTVARAIFFGSTDAGRGFYGSAGMTAPRTKKHTKVASVCSPF